ncbi:hypothetical protein ACJIZ3_005896 [Penstemon smallii]|uniref:Uncharacterized protein n=1 Tax=Penstemon smallii TaxID=265156 RepID=A0ABD3S6A8_9LAMI
MIQFIGLCQNTSATVEKYTGGSWRLSSVNPIHQHHLLSRLLSICPRRMKR